MLLLLLLGCRQEPCAEVADPCTPQYAPTRDEVWTQTLEPSCALSGCHGAGTTTNPLDLGADAASARGALLDGGYVVPGDGACGELVVRLASTGEDAMPPGAPLSEEEQCAVRSWIAEGAP